MALGFSLKKSVISAVMVRRLSNEGLLSRRQKVEKKRLKSGQSHAVDYFHQVDDPYSTLTAMALKPLLEKYNISLTIHIVGSAADSVIPEREKFIDWSRRDAALIAPKYGVSFEPTNPSPASETINQATALLVQAVLDGSCLEVIEQTSKALWSGGSFAASRLATPDDINSHLAASAKKRKKAGHYLGAVFCYGKECYWGLDRLHYLEERLQELGADRFPDTGILYPVPTAKRPQESLSSNTPIDFFVSLRSPYTSIVAKRVFELGRRYNKEVKVRYVLPMVMRGLPVPREKALYIAHDTAREAHRLGIPFGRFKDPLGLPTERGLSLMPLAEEKDVVESYLISFMEGVWSEGIDAGTDKGLLLITDRAGLDWADVQSALNKTEWRKTAEANREELFNLGLWGVPSFRCGDTVLWGQDRLWALEETL
ncbi:MAG: DsbA family protein [Sneathiella sp.]